MSKFGFYTDVHLTNRHIRVDDVAQTALNKLRECYDFAQKNNFDFMVCGGDVFNTQKVMDLKIFLGLIEIMKKFNKPTYFIIGNHDIYGNSFNTYKNSSLYFVSSLIPDLFIPIFDKIQLEDIVLYGCNTYNNVNYCIEHIEPNENKFIVMVDHHMLYDKKIPNAQVINLKDLGENNADLILSGHIHNGYKLKTFGKTSYFNPGSILRMSVDAKKFKVKMAVIQTNGKNFTLDLFFPNIVDGDLVFKENVFSGIEKIAKLETEEHDVNSVESLKHFLQLKESTSSVFELLERIGKENNIDNKIIEYINRFKYKGIVE